MFYLSFWLYIYSSYALIFVYLFCIDGEGGILDQSSPRSGKHGRRQGNLSSPRGFRTSPTPPGQRTRRGGFGVEKKSDLFLHRTLFYCTSDLLAKLGKQRADKEVNNESVRDWIRDRSQVERVTAPCGQSTYTVETMKLRPPTTKPNVVLILSRS